MLDIQASSQKLCHWTLVEPSAVVAVMLKFVAGRSGALSRKLKAVSLAGSTYMDRVMLSANPLVTNCPQVIPAYRVMRLFSFGILREASRTPLIKQGSPMRA